MTRNETGHFLRQPFADRFWAKVARAYLVAEDGALELDYRPCWLWLPKHRHGTQGETGQIRLPRPSPRRIAAPRAALLLDAGILDEVLQLANEAMAGYDAAHWACDTPACCNPCHLSWQTHIENIHDYIYKYGRVAVPKRRTLDPNHLLTPLLDPTNDTLFYQLIRR